MANAGPHTNGSQFFLTFIKCDWLNGKHTVFGRVTDGWGVLDKLEAVGSNSGTTRAPCKIIDCGEIKPAGKVEKESVKLAKEERAAAEKEAAKEKKSSEKKDKKEKDSKMDNEFAKLTEVKDVEMKDEKKKEPVEEETVVAKKSEKEDNVNVETAAPDESMLTSF